MAPSDERLLGADHADADRALAPDRVLGEQLGVLADAALDLVARLEHRLAPAVGQVGGETADADVVVVHPQAGDRLEQPQRELALAPAVDHHRHRAEVHAVGRLEQQVRRHAVELDEQHADPHRALGHLEVEEALRGQAVDELVRQRRRVVHARDVGAALHVRELLAGLLHARVEVADHRLRAQHRLAVELHHDPQHAVRGRVLRTHVDDHRVVDVGPRPARQHHLALARLAGEGAQQLRALVGLRLEPALLRDPSAWRHRGDGSSLKVTGTRGGRRPCAAGARPSRRASGCA